MIAYANEGMSGIGNAVVLMGFAVGGLIALRQRWRERRTPPQ